MQSSSIGSKWGHELLGTKLVDSWEIMVFLCCCVDVPKVSIGNITGDNYELNCEAPACISVFTLDNRIESVT